MIPLWECICKGIDNLLIKWNFTNISKAKIDCDTKLKTLLTILRYWIPPIKYKVYQSQELKTKIYRGYAFSRIVENSLYLKNPHLLALEQLKDFLIMGLNVNSFLSKNLFPPNTQKIKDIKNWLNTKKGDKLLVDWNIYHFHLSPYICRNDLRCRSDALLFAFKYRDNFFFLDVLSHKKAANEKFASTHLLKILFKNWPWLKQILPWVLNIKNLSYELIKPQEIYELRKHNINTVVTINLNGEKIYLMSVDGFSSAGIPISVIKNFLKIRKYTQIKFVTPKIPCYLQVNFYIPYFRYSLKIQQTPQDFEIFLNLPGFF